MKNILPKVSLLACLGLLFAGSTLTGFSQGCNPGGYGEYQAGDYYCIPPAPAFYSSRNYTVQDDWGPQSYSSRNPYRDSDTQNRSPRRDQYGYSGGSCQCAECMGTKGGLSYSSPSRTDDSVNARLNYIESILTFILSHLGFDDKFSAKSKGTPVNPTLNQAPQDNCAGGT